MFEINIKLNPQKQQKVFKPKDGQYHNLNFKPKMNLAKQEVQPLQFVLRPRKTQIDTKKEEEQLIVGKKPSLKIFESKQNLKPLKNIYKFQIEDSNWTESVKPPRSSINPLHLVPNPSDNKEDLEIKKATFQFKNNIIKTTPFKNEYIDNQITTGGGGNNNTNNVGQNGQNDDSIKQQQQQQQQNQQQQQLQQQQQNELESQFKSDSMRKEFAEFLKWQKSQKHMGRTSSQQEFRLTNHSNITDQEHITQIAKCLILTHYNSPSNLKHKKVITLGRPGEDFLRVTKYRDQIYFENKVQKDKVNQNWNEQYSFEENQKTMNSQQLRGSQSLKFGRLSEGLVDEYQPNLRYIRYPLKITQEKDKRLDVSIKRMNRKKVRYLNEIYLKHMSNSLQYNQKYNSSNQNFYQNNDYNTEQQQQQLLQQQQQQQQYSDIAFDDLQNGIYVTALQQQALFYQS